MLVLAVLILAIGLIGCDSSVRQLAPVSGKIKLNGQPLPDATITFQPLANDNPQQAGMGSFARTNENGEFQLRLVDTDELGAWVGKHRVTISRSQPGMGDALLQDVDESIPLKFRDGSEVFQVPAEGTASASFSLILVLE
jgi:hypothetical protein